MTFKLDGVYEPGSSVTAKAASAIGGALPAQASDFTAATKTITFSGGAVVTTAKYAVTTDSIVEPDETFKVEILTVSHSNGGNVVEVGGDAFGIVTINDDDAATIHKRLMTPQFLALAHRALIPGGLFFVQTDNPGYWSYIRQVAPLFFDLEEHPGRWPDAPKGRTRREIIALKKGLPVFRGFGTAKLGLSEADAITRAESLPPPTFNADRKLRALDALEREG